MVPVSMTVLVCAFVSVVDIHWWYGCAIGRLPIFSLGILLYLDNNKNKKYFLGVSIFFAIFFILSAGLYIMGTYMRGYFLTDMITPLLLLLFSIPIYKYSRKLSNSIKYVVIIGNYTLEIYVANVITMKIMRLYVLNCFVGWIVLLLYFLTVIIIALFLIRINKMIKKLLNIM